MPLPNFDVHKDLCEELILTNWKTNSDLLLSSLAIPLKRTNSFIHKLDIANWDLENSNGTTLMVPPGPIAQLTALQPRYR